MERLILPLTVSDAKGGSGAGFSREGNGKERTLGLITVSCHEGAHAQFRYLLCTTDLAASAAIRGGFLNTDAQDEDAISDRFGSCRAAAGICTGHPKGQARSGPDFLRCASSTTLLCGLA